MEQNITFVIGGCRSGKSSFALNQANNIQANNIQADNIQADKKKAKNKIFIATSVPSDLEMEKRVKKHQNERGNDWHTIEEPVSIHEAIDKYSKKASVILVDCLTLWVSNLLFDSFQKIENKEIKNGSKKSDEPQIDKTQINKPQIDKPQIDQAQIDKAVTLLENSLESCQCPVFLVSNEVGTGIVPEDKIARQFRDFAGFVNQRIAKIADTVVMTIAGIDVQIKPV